MRMIELSKLERQDHRPQRVSPYADTDDPTEAVAPAEPPPPATVPTMVNPDRIRCFYRRRNDQPGTRITFADGGGFAVAESYDDVKALVEAATAPPAEPARRAR